MPQQMFVPPLVPKHSLRTRHNRRIAEIRNQQVVIRCNGSRAAQDRNRPDMIIRPAPLGMLLLPQAPDAVSGWVQFDQ